MVSEAHFRDVEATLKPLISLERRFIQGLSARDLIKVMKTDKKNTNADITFILSAGYGRLAKHPLAAERAEGLLNEYLAQIDK